jgi:hypothetical protein
MPNVAIAIFENRIVRNCPLTFLEMYEAYFIAEYNKEIFTADYAYKIIKDREILGSGYCSARHFDERVSYYKTALKLPKLKKDSYGHNK